MATRWTIGADAADPRRLAAFWAEALGYVPEPGYEDADGASIVDPDGVGPAIGFLRVPEPKTAKNRFHLDLRVADLPAGEDPGRRAPVGDEPVRVSAGPRTRAAEERIRAKVADLVAAGATKVREDYYGPALGHVVMLDPEGNEFCVG